MAKLSKQGQNSLAFSSVDELKKVFLKQNRTIAKSHSMLTLRVSQLEDQLSHFKTETYNLKTENLELNRIVRKYEQDNMDLQSHVQHLEQQLEQTQKHQQDIQTGNVDLKQMNNDNHQYCSPEICGNYRTTTTDMYQNLYKLNQKLGEAAKIINSLNISLSPNRRSRGSDQSLLFRDSFGRPSSGSIQSRSRSNSLSSVFVHQRNSPDNIDDDVTTNYVNGGQSIISANASETIGLNSFSRPRSKRSSRRKSGFIDVSFILAQDDSTNNENKETTDSSKILHPIVSSDGIDDQSLASPDSEVSSKDSESLDISLNEPSFQDQGLEDRSEETRIEKEDNKITGDPTEKEEHEESNDIEGNDSNEYTENVSTKIAEHDQKKDNKNEDIIHSSDSDEEEYDEYDSCIPEEEEGEIALQDDIPLDNYAVSEPVPKVDNSADMIKDNEKYDTDIIDLIEICDDYNSQDFQGITFRRSKPTSKKFNSGALSSAIPIHQDQSALAVQNAEADLSHNIALNPKINNSVKPCNADNSVDSDLRNNDGSCVSDYQTVSNNSTPLLNYLVKLGNNSPANTVGLRTNSSNSLSKESQEKVTKKCTTEPNALQTSLEATKSQTVSKKKAIKRTKKPAASSRRLARSAASPASAKRPSPNETETMPETLLSFASISSSSFTSMTPRRPRRNCSKNISYTLPSLSTKLRKEVNSNFDAVITENDIISAVAASGISSKKRKRKVTSETSRKKKSLSNQSDSKLDCRQNSDDSIEVIQKSHEITPTKRNTKPTKTPALGKENIDPSSNFIDM